jgi:hypothetical protein
MPLLQLERDNAITKKTGCEEFAEGWGSNHGVAGSGKEKVYMRPVVMVLAVRRCDP